jgi:chromosome condensin MukBEF complex kleisin-like MukF subunit
MTDHMKEYHKREAARKKAKKDLLKALNTDQQQALKDMNEIVGDVLQTLTECQDVWMSQVAKLETAYYRVNNLVWSSDDE